MRRKTSSAGSLYRLIYRSQACIDQNGPDPDLRAILISARRQNTLNNITGALLFNAAGFAQLLEGPRDIVEQTFERISTDTRHADVRMLSFTPAERRVFSNWPMAFCGCRPTGGQPTTVDAHIMNASDILRYLGDVVHQEDTWIAA